MASAHQRHAPTWATGVMRLGCEASPCADARAFGFPHHVIHSRHLALRGLSPAHGLRQGGYPFHRGSGGVNKAHLSAQCLLELKAWLSSAAPVPLPLVAKALALAMFDEHFAAGLVEAGHTPMPPDGTVKFLVCGSIATDAPASFDPARSPILTDGSAWRPGFNELSSASFAAAQSTPEGVAICGLVGTIPGYLPQTAAAG